MEECKKEINPGTKGACDAPGIASKRRLLRVWVVDDHAELRTLLGQILNQQSGMRCTRQFPSAESVLATLADERPPDMILLDVNLKGQSGLTAIRPILKLAPSVKVVIMTTFSNSHYELEAFNAGASGFLLKTYELSEILTIMREADRRPRDPALFPNLHLQEPKTLDADAQTGLPGKPAKRFSLFGSFQQLCGVPRRRATN